MSKYLAILFVTVLLAGFAGAAEAPTAPLSNPSIAPDVLLDKISGSLYGKCIGLVLGQPVEGWTKQDIEKQASLVKAYPVTYYFPKDFNSPHKSFLLGNIDCYPPNDDTALMTMGLIVMREHGLNFTPKDLAQVWAKHMDFACTAEGIGLYNFKKGVWPPESAVVDNPYCQWIGAQMRADIWGMISPGLPQTAAEFAERDASITHVGSGVYGARYVAAMISLAFTNNDVRSIIEQALSVIPEHSEYARAVRDVIACYDRGDDWQKAWQLIDDRYGWNEDGTRVGSFPEARYNTGKDIYQWANSRWVHAVPNGAMVTLALLYGKGDFSNSISLATMCGADCDCNGGTTGCIIGAIIGAKAIPAKWKEPLNNRFKSGISHDFPEEVKISDLAAEITGFAQQQLKAHELAVSAAKK